MLRYMNGGVLTWGLNVYRTSNWAIVDASVFPLFIPSSPMATCYAVAARQGGNY
ncbi:hypothetical protein BDW68DRAFT_167457 [Aspergillus falconensis]